MVSGVSAGDGDEMALYSGSRCSIQHRQLLPADLHDCSCL